MILQWFNGFRDFHEKNLAKKERLCYNKVRNVFFSDDVKINEKNLL